MDTGTESGADTAGSASSTHTSFSGDTSANRPSLDEIRARARDIQQCDADVFAGVGPKEETWWNIRSWESRSIVGVVNGTRKEAEEHQFLHFCTELRLDPKTGEVLKGGRIATEENALSGAAGGAASTSNLRSIKDHMERNFKKDREGTQHTIKDQQVESRGGDKGHAIGVSKIDKTLSDEVIDVTLSDDETKDLEETEGAGGSRGNPVVDKLHQGVTIDLSHDDDNAEAALSTEQNKEKLIKTTHSAKSKGKAKGKGRKSSTACVVGGDDDVSGKATAAGESAGKTTSSGVKDETVEEGTGEGGGNGKGRLCSAVCITVTHAAAPPPPKTAKTGKAVATNPLFSMIYKSRHVAMMEDQKKAMDEAAANTVSGRTPMIRNSAKKRLKVLEAKVYGVGDTLKILTGHSKSCLGKVVRLHPLFKGVVVQMFYRRWEVADALALDMQPNEVLRTTHVRCVKLSDIVGKVSKKPVWTGFRGS